MLLRTLQAPPPKGSLQEWALIYLLERLEDIEHARYLALVQVIINKDEGVKAFDRYMKVAFPSLALRKKKEDEETKAALEWWTKRGPMKITPLVPLNARSKMKTRLVRVTKDVRAAQIYEQIGQRWGSQIPTISSTPVPNAEARR